MERNAAFYAKGDRIVTRGMRNGSGDRARLCPPNTDVADTSADLEALRRAAPDR